MESIEKKWGGLALQARVGIVIGIVLIAGLMLALGLWAYRPDYQVLFSDIAPRDAAAMTAELDKMKTPYQLADGGNSILVPKDLVYKTRLALMGKDVPLHGAVGFEVFNNADFGMTEFVQKVNYLRAIQGELTRTILSIEEIQAARVHLAIPEQGLFKKAITKPKASVTVTMKPGNVLSAEQVAGIQRLVAASVPDILSADVTLLDQRGVALTRVAASEAGGDGALGQLDSKRSTEDYLVKKVTAVLDRTFGAGEAIATVDVALNMDQSKVTTEDVLPARAGRTDGSPTGVVVRERHTIRDGDTSAPLSAGNAKSGGAHGNTTAEADYQVGRRIEQVAVATGTVRRMTVAVVVKQTLSASQLEKLKEVVALAIGFNAQRGDAIVVNSMDSLVSSATSGAAIALATAPGAAEVENINPGPPQPANAVVWALGALLCSALAAGLVYLGMRRRSSAIEVHADMDAAAREQMLLNVRQWIAMAPEAVPAAVVRK